MAALLTQTGDFLVRESTKKLGEYVVSAKKPDKVQHFIIGVTAGGQYTFEGGAFPSISALIDHYRTSAQVVTSSSGVILKQGVRVPSRSIPPGGGQFDFVWLPARAPHGGASYVW